MPSKYLIRPKSFISKSLGVWHMLICQRRIEKSCMQRVNHVCSLATVMRVKHIGFTTPKPRKHLFPKMSFLRREKCIDSKKNAL